MSVHVTQSRPKMVNIGIEALLPELLTCLHCLRLARQRQ